MSFIIDTDVNKWISNYDLDKDTHILNTILNIGYNVLKITKVQVNDNSAINGYLINQEKIINSNVDLIKEKIIIIFSSFKLINLNKYKNIEI